MNGSQKKIYIQKNANSELLVNMPVKPAEVSTKLLTICLFVCLFSKITFFITVLKTQYKIIILHIFFTYNQFRIILEGNTARNQRILYSPNMPIKILYFIYITNKNDQSTILQLQKLFNFY